MGHGTEINTLGDLVAHGYTLRAHCGRRECGHHALLDLELLIDRLGADHPSLAPHLVPRLRCRECGSRDVGLTLDSNQGFRPSSSKGPQGGIQT